MAAIHAFTTSYNGISNKLINDATLIYGDKEYKTKVAQWDTGATNTCISERVVNELGLIPIGKVKMQTPSGEIIANEYRIDIKLQNENVLLRNIYVVYSEIGKQGIDMLIGMNIITLGDFAVTNYEGKTVFTFRFPSQGCTDYVRLINSSIPVKKNKIQPNDLCPCGSGKKYKRCCGKNN